MTVDNTASVVLYFGWSFVMSFLFFILTGKFSSPNYYYVPTVILGFIGFVASLAFVQKIFSSIKID